MVLYHLHELSFREYLKLRYKIDFPFFSLDEILNNHIKIALQITRKIRVLKYFKEYLEYGNFPFILEGQSTYKMKIIQMIDKVLYEDLPSVHPIKYSGILKLKRLLNIISSSKPFQINIDKMSKKLQISKEFLYRYLDYLARANLILMVWYKQRGSAYHRKPAKIYFHNPNLLSSLNLSEKMQNYIGFARENFFINQLIKSNLIYASKTEDFLTENNYRFEIGGKSKLSRTEDNLFYAIDKIEIGSGNRIPLYLFGFLY